MSGGEGRSLPPSPAVFVRGADVEAQAVSAIEGAAETGPLSIKPLLVGDNVLFMEVRRGAGLVDPEHAHDDHESFCYLVSGRMRVVIDGAEFVAGPGDIWRHAPDVPHYHEALEDCLQIEIKSPARRTWD